MSGTGRLRNLFGRGTLATRLAAAERLLAQGEPGLALGELNSVLADSGLGAAGAHRARVFLPAAKDTLARARLSDALNLSEAGDAHGARFHLEAVLELALVLSLPRVVLAHWLHNLLVSYRVF